MIRFHTIKILLKKEFLRLRKNPSAITLLVLLAGIALLVSISWTDPETGESKCFVTFDSSWENSNWVRYLDKYDYLQPDLEVVPRKDLLDSDGKISLKGNDCAIELLPAARTKSGMPNLKVAYHYPEGKDALVNRHSSWFWMAWMQFESSKIDFDVVRKPRKPGQSTGMASTIRESAANKLDISLITTMLLLSVQFFACCHLYVSFASQDRERGTLQALAMSPASLFEIVTARTIFHQTLGLAVCALVLLIVRPDAVLKHQVWMTLIAVGFAWLAVGTIITTIAKTQNQASMMMFCYMLGGGILFFMASQFPIFAMLQNVSFENHAVNILHTSLDKGYYFLVSAIAMIGISIGWMVLGMRMFHRSGWQT